MTAVASPERPLLHRVLKNAGVLLGGRAANAVISLGYMAVAARLLGVREVGVLILINAFAQLVGEVVKFNSWQTVLRFGAAPLADGRREQFQQVVRFTTFLDFTSGLVGVTVAAAVAFFAGHKLGWGPQHAPAAAVYCLTAAMMTPATATGILRLFNRFDVLAAQAPIGSAVRLIGGGVALLAGVSLNVFLLVCGCFIPPAGIILMTAPILLPIITTAGFDPVWFGVIITINMEIGLIHPPVGLNIYIVNSIAPDVPVTKVMWGTIPYVLCMMLSIVILCIFPEIATWLPDHLMGVAVHK